MFSGSEGSGSRMSNSICGADCTSCGFGENYGCKGCNCTGGCPFGAQCFIASYIKADGMEGYNVFKKTLIDEINSLGIEGLFVNELYALNGSFVNLAYPMPSGYEVKLLNDNAIYLGNQVECGFSDGEEGRCYGIVADMNFILISEYGMNGSNAEIVMYKRR